MAPTSYRWEHSLGEHGTEALLALCDARSRELKREALTEQARRAILHATTGPLHLLGEVGTQLVSYAQARPSAGTLELELLGDEAEAGLLGSKVTLVVAMDVAGLTRTRPCADGGGGARAGRGGETCSTVARARTRARAGLGGGGKGSSDRAYSRPLLPAPGREPGGGGQCRGSEARRAIRRRRWPGRGRSPRLRAPFRGRPRRRRPPRRRRSGRGCGA